MVLSFFSPFASQLFLEVELAQLTRLLSRLQFRGGDHKAAAATLLELHVETQTRLPLLLKIDFLLEQLRLCLDTDDLVHALVVIRKIPARKVFGVKAPASLSGADLPPTPSGGGDGSGEASQASSQPPLPVATQGLAIRYYYLVVQYHARHAHYLKMTEAFLSLLGLPIVQENVSLRSCALDHAIFCTALAPRGPAQQAQLHTLAQRTDLHLATPEANKLVRLLTSARIVMWDEVKVLVEQVGTRSDRQVRLFLDPTPPAQADEELSYFRRQHYNSLGEQRVHHLLRRVVSHNLAILARFYSAITFETACTLLAIDVPTLEQAPRYRGDRVQVPLCPYGPASTDDLVPRTGIRRTGHAALEPEFCRAVRSYRYHLPPYPTGRRHPSAANRCSVRLSL